jgi:hypothetical protein
MGNPLTSNIPYGRGLRDRVSTPNPKKSLIDKMLLDLGSAFWLQIHAKICQETKE